MHLQLKIFSEFSISRTSQPKQCQRFSLEPWVSRSEALRLRCQCDAGERRFPGNGPRTPASLAFQLAFELAAMCPFRPLAAAAD